MNALQVYRLGDIQNSRFYLDGRRVTRSAYREAEYGRRTDCYALRMHTRRDGSTIVREYHCIRVHS